MLRSTNPRDGTRRGMPDNDADALNVCDNHRDANEFYSPFSRIKIALQAFIIEFFIIMVINLLATISILIQSL